MKKIMLFCLIFILVALVGCDKEAEEGPASSTTQASEQNIGSTEQSTASSTNDNDDSLARVEPFVALKMNEEYSLFVEDDAFEPNSQISMEINGKLYIGEFYERTKTQYKPVYIYKCNDNVEIAVFSNGELSHIEFCNTVKEGAPLTSDAEYKKIADEFVGGIIDIEQYEFRLDPAKWGYRIFVYERCIDGLGTTELVSGLFQENGMLYRVSFRNIGSLSAYSEVEISEETIEKAIDAVYKRLEKEYWVKEDEYSRKEYFIEGSINVTHLNNGGIALIIGGFVKYCNQKDGDVDISISHSFIVPIE